MSDGGPSQCNPTSKKYCCSKWGWCGAQGDTPGDNDTDHCAGGIDYRIKDEWTLTFSNNPLWQFSKDCFEMNVPL